MARAPDIRIKEAYELFKSGVKLVEIASRLTVPAGTVRRWKSTYKWDSERSDKNSERSDKQGKDISWVKLENEYVTDIRKKPCNLKYFSEFYNIDYDYLRRYAANNEWNKKRENYITNVSQKIIEKSANKDAERIAKLLEITDKAAMKAEQSLNELETYIVKNKKRVKEIEYKDSNAFGKPTKEVVYEDEKIDTVPGPVDRQGLMFITSSLKNIKELYSITSDIKMQEHKVEYDNSRLELEKLKANTDNNDKTINIIHNIPRPKKEGGE
jgi:hypothetical protein